MALYEATKRGWTGTKIVEEGDVFVLPKGKTSKWFKPYKGSGKEPVSETVPVTDEGIVAALSNLDPDNEDQWTGAGLAKMTAVEQALGCDPKALTRADLNRVAPNFCRANAKVDSVLD